MLILMVRYVFMYWILLGGGTGEHLREDDMPEGEFYRLSACTAKCMQRRQQALASQSTHFRDCYDLCKSGNASAPMPPAHLRQIQENYSLKLICRDDRSLTFRINLEQSSAIAIETEAATDAEAVTQSSGDMATVAAGAGAWEAATDAIKTGQAVAVASHLNETLYLIKVYSSKDIILYLSDDNFFTIPNLQANAVHNITAVAVHASYEYSVIAKEQPYETLARGYTPSMVTNIQVKDFSVDEVNDMRLVARLTWKPSADMTCHYNIICFAPKDLEYDMSPLEIRNPRQLYSYNLDNLTFSSVYKVGIRAKNPNNGSKESALLWKTFQAPSCVEWYHYNFNICPPFQPDGLEVERIYVRENVYSFNVSWQLPQYLPDYYTLHILDIADGGDSYFFNVSKELNAFFVHEVTICGVLYEVHLTAYTPGGNATAVNTQFNTKLIVVPDKSHHFVKWIAAILAPIFCFAILSLTTFIICHRRAKLKRYQERCKYFEELEKKAPIDPKATFDFPTKSLPLLTSPEDLTQFQLDLEDKIFFNDAMEIDHNDVTLYEVLGEGAFGLVRRGIYNDNKLGAREVAVKMLKDQPSIDDVRAFRREIEVMKSVEKHSNIVGIIGHCTKRYNEMMLLTEYCSFGNLLDFLRDEWKYLYEMNMKRSTAHSMPRMHNNRRHRPASRHLEWHSAPQTPHQPQHKNNNNNNNNNNTNNYNSISHINSNGGVGVFNIDATIIEKLKMKYRNLSALQQKRPPTSVATLCGPQMDSASTECVSPATTSSTTTMVTIATPPPPPTPLYSPALATDNKSYGYDAICSNTCKCRLGLVIENFDPRDSNANSGNAEQRERQPSGDAPPLPTKVPQCECQQLRLAKKNRKNTATITDMQQQQQQQQQELSVGHRSCFKRLPDVGSFEVALRQRQWQRRNARAVRNQEEANNGSSNSSSNVSSLNGSSKALSASIRREPLSAADLVDIARQVAVGMEFLAKNKVVHRDLAARNVLVAPDRTIKIADFGLSRDIYQENVYKKTGNGKLPIKWLALESMTHQVYTTQSDVWSYGILLYEIVTLGGTPYPSIPTNRLLHLLKTGYRMEKPKNCGQEFYNLMYACWNVNPAERPTFAEIIQILENLLADAPHQQIESVLGVTTKSQSEQPQQQQQQHGADVELTTVNTDDSYLKPL